MKKRHVKRTNTKKSSKYMHILQRIIFDLEKYLHKIIKVQNTKKKNKQFLLSLVNLKLIILN